MDIEQISDDELMVLLADKLHVGNDEFLSKSPLLNQFYVWILEGFDYDELHREASLRGLLDRDTT